MSLIRRLADQFAWTSRGEWAGEVALPARSAGPLTRTEPFVGELAAAFAAISMKTPNLVRRTLKWIPDNESRQGPEAYG
jgi:hypothetical protein